MIHTNVEATNVDSSNLFTKQIYVNINTLTQKAKFHIEPIVALEIRCIWRHITIASLVTLSSMKQQLK
jgi:hypothetical protein